MNADLPGAALLLDGRRDDEPTLALAHDALVDGLAAGGWASQRCISSRPRSVIV